MNVSMDAIKTEWTDINEKHHLLKIWKFFGFRHQQLITSIQDAQNCIKITIPQMCVSEDIHMLEKIDDLMTEYRAENTSLTFKTIIARKFKDIADELLITIVTAHTAKLVNPLRKFDIWMDANVMSPEQIDKSFKSLDYEFEKHFGLMNVRKIYYWFYKHQSRVPHDWEARLTGLNRDDKFLVTGYYKRDLETYWPNISIFFEFLEIVDYTVRESFEWVEDPSANQNFFEYYRKVDDLYNARKDSMGNLSNFFEDWRDMFPANNAEISLLENVYQRKFKNVTIAHELPYFWHYVKRGLFFLQDVYNFKEISDPDSFLPSNLLTLETISDKLKGKIDLLYGPFKKNFFNRHAQKLISLESSTIDFVVSQINGVLMQQFKAQFDDWQTSQPYRKLATLKYTYHNFDDFFRGIDIIFATMFLPYPEEFDHLKEMENVLENLQKKADALSVKEKISTRWDWGRGLRMDKEVSINSAISLSSPINVGFKTIISAVEKPFASASYFNSILLLASVLLLKIRKIKWRL
jgi:hypothetical protein